MSEVVFGSHLDLDSNEIRNARLLNLTSGTAPGTPADGDVWTTTSGIYARINGATVGPLLGSTVWGTVTGTLSDQTDLQSALDLKAPLASPTFTGTVSLSTLTADTINGRDPDDLVLGPASATDNALVRFDGTGGKTAQNSGITVDDSNNITSNVTISKTNAALTVTAASGSPYFIANSTSGNDAALIFRTSASNRWLVSRTATVESGSNVGSDFAIASYTDAGALLRTDLTITRSTGAVTLTGDLTLSKSDAKLTVDSTANDGYANIQALANKYAGVIVRTGSSPRWGIVKSNYGEPGSNVGSDLLITGYSDAGSSLGNWLTIERANGKVTLNGALALSGSQHTIKNGTPTTLNFAKGSQWGYSSGYRAIILGDTAGSPNNVTVAIGYDPVGNANGSFTGNGSEVLFRNAVEFTTPNAANNAWLKPLKFDSSGNTTLLGLTAGTANFTGDLTINKASATHTINSTSGTTNVNLDSVAGTYKYLNFRTGTSVRWTLGTTATAESGSNAGTDLFIGRSTDGGAYIDAVLSITRSTGKTTLGSVGATAGLELGYSGPRVMSGTGSPEGVVTAPVGSQWIDTAATTGAVAWRKASGTGSSGWVVEYGDTGRRSLAAVLSNSWTASSISLQRSGNIVTLWARTLIGTSASSAVFYTLPVGFRPTADYVPFPIAQSGGTYAAGRGTVDTAGEVTVGGTITDYTAARLLVSFPTADAWPATLPGS